MNVKKKELYLIDISKVLLIYNNNNNKTFSTIKGSLTCLSSPGRANYDFQTKLGEKFTLKKRKLGRLE